MVKIRPSILNEMLTTKYMCIYYIFQHTFYSSCKSIFKSHTIYGNEQDGSHTSFESNAVKLSTQKFHEQRIATYSIIIHMLIPRLFQFFIFKITCKLYEMFETIRVRVCIITNVQITNAFTRFYCSVVHELLHCCMVLQTLLYRWQIAL